MVHQTSCFVFVELWNDNVSCSYCYYFNAMFLLHILFLKSSYTFSNFLVPFYYTFFSACYFKPHHFPAVWLLGCVFLFQIPKIKNFWCKSNKYFLKIGFETVFSLRFPLDFIFLLCISISNSWWHDKNLYWRLTTASEVTYLSLFTPYHQSTPNKEFFSVLFTFSFHIWVRGNKGVVMVAL